MEEEGAGCLEERRASMSHYRRRTSNHHLTLDVDLARARGGGGGGCRVCTPPAPTLQQVQHEGKLLFNNFIRQDMQTHGLLDHTDLVTPSSSPASTGPKNPVWAKAGRELREMADAFSRTKERQRLRDRAYGVDLMSPHQEDYTELLTELFPSGHMTRHRVLLLFTLCSDVMMRALREQSVAVFSQLQFYSQCYITDTVCPWVTHRGGWECALSRSAEVVTQVVVTLAAFISLMCVVKWVVYKK